MLENPLPLPVLLNDSLLTALGVPLDGTPTQRQTVMQLVEAMVMAHLNALIVDSNTLVPPVNITEIHPLLFDQAHNEQVVRTFWGPITSVVSLDLLAYDGTVVSSLLPGDYALSLVDKGVVRITKYIPDAQQARVVYTAGYANANTNPNLLSALKLLYELYSSTLITNRGMNAEEQIQNLNNKATAVTVKPLPSSLFGQHQAAATARRLLDTSGLRIVRGVYALWV